MTHLGGEDLLSSRLWGAALPILAYDGIFGTLSVLQHHLKTLMSFYSRAQILLVLLMWSVPQLKMCTIQVS